MTGSGEIAQGVLQRVTDQWIELLDKDGKAIRISVDEIEEQRNSIVSIMPTGLEEKLTAEDFADLIAYLSTLKQAEQTSRWSVAPNRIEQASSPVGLVPCFGDMTFDHPVWIGEVPGDGDHKPSSIKHFVVLEQAGRAYYVESANRPTRKLLFDLSSSVRLGGATGLLGMAFHPQFNANKRFFIKYQTIESGAIQTVVEERSLDQDDLENSPRRLMTIAATTQDHNGGCLEFGPDGYLYIGMGDSGPQRDPQGHGQDLNSLLGKILRIDVDQVDAGLAYRIPIDNPFRDQADARGEIWAFGFREPWRFSFDDETGDLWVGDVGQDRFEEVGIVRRGENHGWNVLEGFAEHSNAFRRESESYVQPIFSYPRNFGVSVTGGYVYHGKRTPSFSGWYVLGDFESRRMWALRQTDRSLSEVIQIGRAPTRIVSFGVDRDKELYLVGFDNGVIYHMDFNSMDMTPLQTRVLAETAQSGPIQWRYTTTTPAEGWMKPEFDDSDWLVGPSGFGSENTPGAIVRTDWRNSDIWMRRSFDVPEPIRPSSSINLSIHHDEDVEVFLNGVEAVRLTRWTSGYVDAKASLQASQSLRATANTIAVHCHQVSGGQYIDVGVIHTTKPNDDSKSQ